VERQLFRVLYELGRLYDFNARRQQQGSGASSAPAAGEALDYRGKPLTPDRTARRFAGLFLLPEAAVRATVAQLGIEAGDWDYGLLLRIKHRFGVSAEAFLYRLDELGLIARKLVAPLRERIHAHYAATHNTEPASTRRILSPNGRLGDLFLIASRGPEQAEVAAIRTTLRRYGVALGDDAPVPSSSTRSGPARRTMPNPDDKAKGRTVESVPLADAGQRPATHRAAERRARTT
jgi:hypothetical protein